MTDYKSTPQNLFYQIKNGSIDAFNKVYDEYKTKIFLFAFKILKSKDLAKEIVNEVFVELWNTRDRIIKDTYNSILFIIAYDKTMSMVNINDK